MELYLIGVILVILVVAYYMYSKSGESFAEDLDLTKEWNASSWAKAKQARDSVLIAELDKKANIGENTISENINYYSNCKTKCGDEPIDAHLGEDYMSALGAQLISPEMQNSHNKFVSEESPMMGTGRSFTVDSHDSYNPVPWVGIMGRPQNVPVGNPDQLPDIDRRMFADFQRIRL